MPPDTVSALKRKVVRARTKGCQTLTVASRENCSLFVWLWRGFNRRFFITESFSTFGSRQARTRR